MSNVQTSSSVFSRGAALTAWHRIDALGPFLDTEPAGAGRAPIPKEQELPTTLAAVLNSLQLGFRTLAIQKHSGQIQKVLLAVKSDFSKFGEVLEKEKKKLKKAGNVIDDAAKKKNAVERTLRSVEGLPAAAENGNDYLTDGRTPSLFDQSLTGK